MTPVSHAGGTPTAWRRTGLVAVVVVASVLGLTGCSKVINAIRTAHNVLHQGAAISALSKKLKTSDAKAYDVSYVTTGANPVTTEYAASPPHDFAFGTTLSDKMLHVISNPTGEYACSKSLSVSSHAGSSGSLSRRRRFLTHQQLLDNLAEKKATPNNQHTASTGATRPRKSVPQCDGE